MKPYNFYFSEWNIRILYISFSLILCITVLIFYADTIFLFEIYPFIVLTHKRFIITQLTDFLDVVWNLTFFFSFLFSLPVIFYHIKTFFNNSWYSYQIFLFKSFVVSTILLFFLSYVLIHNFLLPTLFLFFLQWEIVTETSLIRIESEVSILLYIKWVLFFKTIFSSFILWLHFILKLLFYFIDLIWLYRFIKTNKNIFFFISLFLTYLITPPGVFMQFFVFLCNFLFYEFSFLFLCFQFSKFNFKIL